VERALTPAEFRAVWERKPVLRAVYEEHYRLIAAWARPGRTVEIGAGAGNLKDSMPRVLSSDITPAEWLDILLDAQALPFATGSLANVIGVDVLHHIEYPRHLLTEAARVLEPGGRVVFVEPAITPVSWLVFKLGHPEPVDLGVDPLSDGLPNPSKHPFESNQAIPTLLAGRHRGRFEREFPQLQLVHHQRLSPFAYPLSGGYRPWCLLPERLVQPVMRFENRLTPALGPLMAFRLLMVIEKRHG
jgi:SAM-dependent methyltransferase